MLPRVEPPGFGGKVHLRRSGVQTQTAGAAGDDGNLALQGEERGEISQDCLRHCELVFI